VITYVIPTRDRPSVLAETLSRLAALPHHDAEVLLIDNASASAVRVGPGLANGLRVKVVRSEVNLCAAARNLAIEHASPRSQWLVMLDDDSSPLDAGLVQVLRNVPEDVGVVAAEIFLPSDASGNVRRESGGLPEVFIGCGAAIRTTLFATLGGYDHSFDYYAEEYDLSARIMLAGSRIVLDRGFRVEHRKVSTGRDMNRILGNLVRNNAWVAARYAPDAVRSEQIREHVCRYGKIARKESALRGYVRGIYELGVSLADQPRRPMTMAMWDRFTGLAAARHSLRTAWTHDRFGSASIVLSGKNVRQVEESLREMGVELEEDPEHADVVVIGTLSPGPMLDGWAEASRRWPARRVIMPWAIEAPMTASEQGLAIG